jgi:hypothetical protein
MPTSRSRRAPAAAGGPSARARRRLHRRSARLRVHPPRRTRAKERARRRAPRHRKPRGCRRRPRAHLGAPPPYETVGHERSLNDDPSKPIVIHCQVGMPHTKAWSPTLEPVTSTRRCQIVFERTCRQVQSRRQLFDPRIPRHASVAGSQPHAHLRAVHPLRCGAQRFDQLEVGVVGVRDQRPQRVTPTRPEPPGSPTAHDLPESSDVVEPRAPRT